MNSRIAFFFILYYPDKLFFERLFFILKNNAIVYIHNNGLSEQDKIIIDDYSHQFENLNLLNDGTNIGIGMAINPTTIICCIAT